MNTIITNANIITGDGSTILENRSIVLDGEFIETISKIPCPYYIDMADYAIDARGGFVIPGVINHHTHGTISTAWIGWVGYPPLAKSRIAQNLNLHLRQASPMSATHYRRLRLRRSRHQQ